LNFLNKCKPFLDNRNLEKITSDAGFYILEFFLSLLKIVQKQNIKILEGTRNNLWGAAKQRQT